MTAPQAISALHPVAVIAASGEADLSGISDSQWIAGFTKLFDASTAGSPSAVRILLGTSPFSRADSQLRGGTSESPAVRAARFTRFTFVLLDVLGTRPENCGRGTGQPDPDLSVVLSRWDLLARRVELCRLCRSGPFDDRLQPDISPVVTTAVIDAITQH